VVGHVAAAGRPLPVGAHLAALAGLAGTGSDHDPAADLGVAVDLRPDGQGRLQGRCWGTVAPDGLVLATPDGGLGLVAGSDCTLTADPMPSFDEVDVRRVSVDPARVQRVGDAGARRAFEAAVALMLAAEVVAGLDDATDRTLAYLEDRQAFGKPLAAQQVLQHRAVEVHTVRVLASSTLELACAAAEAGSSGAAASWSAKLFAGTRGLWAAEEAIQLHGGIGFTWELGLHQVLRRAQRARLLLGGTARAAAEVVAGVDAGPRPGLVDWTLRPLPALP
jgi:alkylation response protein AidB-like acyl-CoA dehydrogenase